MERPCIWILGVILLSLLLIQVIAPDHVIFGIPIGFLCWLWARREARRSPISLAALIYTFASWSIVFSAVTITMLAARQHFSSPVSRWAELSRYETSVPIELEARIRSVQKRVESITVTLDQLTVLRRGQRIALQGRIRILTWSDDLSSNWSKARAGTLIRVSGKLVKLKTRKNPSDFDERAYLNSIGIVADFSPISDVVLIPEGFVSPFSPSALMANRERLLTHIRRVYVSESARSLIPAMLLGERQYLTAETKNHFRLSGLSHLLAISGLHVGILGYSVFWLLGSVLRRLSVPTFIRQGVRAGVSLVVLFLFVLITGAPASVVRAALMGAVLIVGTVIARRSDTLNLLAFAASTMIAYQPDVLFTPGFQLSFTAVAAIILFESEPPFIQKLPFRFARQTGALILVSGFIFCATFPVMMYHFGEVTAAGIVLNVVAIPVATLFMIASLLSIAWSAATVPMAQEMILSASFIAGVLVFIAEHGSSIFESAMISGTLGVVRPATFIPLVLAIPLLKSIGSNPARTRTCLLPVLVGALFLLISDQAIPRRAATSFLSVGQGDAALITFDKNKCGAIDTGPGYASYQSVKRHLSSVGCSELSFVLITHDHADHTGGLPFLINDGLVKSIIGPPAILNGKKSREKVWHKRARAASINVTTLSAGHILMLDSDAAILILSPDSNEVSGPQIVSENTSVVAALFSKHQKILFMGDTEWDQEKNIILKYGSLLRSSTVKIGHHGSKTSSSASFVFRTVIPDTTSAVFSYGIQNRFGHPSPLIRARWQHYKSVVHEHRYVRVLQ